MRPLAVSGLLFGLAACGNTASVSDFRAIGAEATEALATISTPDAPAANIETFVARLDRDVEGPLLVAYVPVTNALAGLIPFGENGDYVTWATQDAQSLTRKNGVLTATRGLGDDLMSANIAGTLKSLRAGGGSGYLRTYRHLDGDGRTAAISYDCEMRRAAQVTAGITRYEEVCVSGVGDITNTYWLESGAGIVRSKEYVSAQVGWIEIRDLSDRR